MSGKRIVVGAVVFVLAAGAVIATTVRLHDNQSHNDQRHALSFSSSSSSSITLRVLAETSKTITLGWDQQQGADGFRFYRNGSPVSSSFDGTLTQVKFSKGTSYRVHTLLPGPDGIYPPPTPPAADLFVSPSGSDGNACTSSAPCLTLQRAFTVATAGQKVRVATGSYGGQSLSGDRGGTVTFAADPGVTLTGQVYITGAHHLVLDGFTFASGSPYRDLQIDSCNDDITISHATGQRFNIFEGNSNITMADSSWGGYADPSTTSDSGIGTTGANGPTRPCAAPSTGILLIRDTFHDVFWQQPNWGSAHPDCFEINGHVNGVTIRDSTFIRCGDSFLGLYPDQGDLLNLTVDHNTFTDLNNYGPVPPTPTPAQLAAMAKTYYGIQQVGSGSNGHACGNVTFTNNSYSPDNPYGGYPYSSLRFDCVPKAGYAPASISGNTFQSGPPSTECATSKAPPYLTVWAAGPTPPKNTFTKGNPC